ncbi:MAG: agmatine deiminase family protein [Alphaproteobacteria bacterium]|nr:agmatine deiminase family protein [Alphaproteobacteria bacterium]
MTRVQSSRLVQPAEWEPHAAVWSAWPSHGDLWLEDLEPARAEVASLFKAIADVRDGTPRGEALRILACGDEAVTSARAALAGTGAEVLPATFGDIWLRDTAPIFIREAGAIAGACFKFNGWGGKYVLDGDDAVAPFVAGRAGVKANVHDFVLEGGSIDVDGRGTALTTRQCLLNPNRNPHLTQRDLETRLRANLGIEKLIWLGDGLANDHTDGHIDNIARFIAPGVVACMEPSGRDDPNAQALRDIIDDLRMATDIDGHKFEVVTIPSPGRVEDGEGEVVPVSHMNFYIGNTTVVMPTYGTRYDDAAVMALSRLFPARKVTGLPAGHVITGGGSFHCITQQQPAEPGK